MSGDFVTSSICIVLYSRDWHQASHSFTFCRFVWLSGAELITSQFTPIPIKGKGKDINKPLRPAVKLTKV